ncbi:MAG: 6-phosphogluconolactonase [Ascidiaceihabitans sp.]|nr:6-phosphogluconolactonase [Ascidiaceihabitans sp.]
MNIKEYVDREMLVIDVANILAGDLKTALLTQDQVTFVVPGGTTPGPIFDILCAADLDWSRVKIMLSDERWVPSDHARSNAKLLAERLLVERAGAAQFVPFYVDEMTSEDGAAAVSAQIADTLPISVLVLGMGADMHTASLFPNAIGLEAALANDANALCAIQAQGQEPRVTLSGPALNGAMSKHLVIFGDDKRAALKATAGLSVHEAPISAVTSGMTIHWAA